MKYWGILAPPSPTKTFGGLSPRSPLSPRPWEREETVFSLIRHVTTNGVGTAVYKQRAQIMKDVFEIERLPANVNRINGECCIASLVKAIWLLPVISEVSTCSSANCPNNRTDNEVQVLTVHQSMEDEVTVLEQRMQRSLEDRHTNCLAEVKEYADDLDSTSCLTDASISPWPTCIGRRINKMTINGSYLFAEVIKPNVNCTVEVEVRLCDIPEAVHLQSNTFLLRG
jgi:hypothetical protein